MGTIKELFRISYYINDQEIPIMIKCNIAPDEMTLGAFKAAIKLPNPSSYKYYFKNIVEEVGIVKEEISDDNANLPTIKGNNIISWLVSENQNETNFSPRGGPRSLKYNHHCNYDSSATASDMDSTVIDSDDDDDDDETISQFSTTTDETSVSKLYEKGNRRRKPMLRMSRASSDESSTISMDVITVTLNLDAVNFLGISIVGKASGNRDGGIYVGSIMKGGAVAHDGRISQGDMILQVNDVNFEHMSNEEAVQVLRDAVSKPGPIKLVVAKYWDSSPKSYFTLPRNEPVRPIDPGAWVAHTEAALGFKDLPLRPPSANTIMSGSSIPSSTEGSEQRQLISDKAQLTLNAGMDEIAKSMASRDSGLDVKDRIWLKIIIPKSFLGSDVVDWLYTHVQGFIDRKAARKYASEMLKQRYIVHTVNKNSFSEQCYYKFGEMV